ncbi:MAG TPA: hypothetical protein VFR17_04950 [Mycobacterium sp.]|nr:hypothetical protein [Mycobacterium sp.]
MPKTDRDGRSLVLSLSRFLSKRVRDHEIAVALQVPVSTYSKRKDKPDFPTFDELRRIADQMGVDETALLVDFGYLDITHLNDELQQRYAAYRNAIDVIASMRHEPQHGATATKTAPRQQTASKGSSKSGRPPRIADAQTIRPL